MKDSDARGIGEVPATNQNASLLVLIGHSNPLGAVLLCQT